MDIGTIANIAAQAALFLGEAVVGQARGVPPPPPPVECQVETGRETAPCPAPPDRTNFGRRE